MSRITTRGFAQMLVQAGVITQDEANMTARIVIDCPHDGSPMVYIERFADSGALAKLAPMLRDVLPAELVATESSGTER